LRAQFILFSRERPAWDCARRARAALWQKPARLVGSGLRRLCTASRLPHDSALLTARLAISVVTP
jgi:hypothetical protein